MISNKKIQSTKFEDYEIRVVYKDKNFFLKIDELSLIIKSPNLDAGYAKLKKKYLDLLSIYQESNQECTLPEPKKQVKNNTIINELKIFIYKFLIIGIIALLISFFSASFIAFKVRQLSVVDLIKSEVRTIVTTVYEKLPKDDNAKKAQMKNFKEIINEIKPYIDELNSIK